MKYSWMTLQILLGIFISFIKEVCENQLYAELGEVSVHGERRDFVWPHSFLAWNQGGQGYDRDSFKASTINIDKRRKEFLRAC